MTSPSTPYVLTFGETMALMRSEQPGPLSHASSLSLGIGGSESNVAIGLRRLGVHVVWCGRVGNDALGQLVEREIRAEGVDVRVTVDREAPTGLMIKERRTPRTQRVSYYRRDSAGSRISPDDVGDALIADAGLFHVSGITPALSAQAEATLRYAVASARTAGVPVSFDLNYRRNLWSPEGAGSVYRDIIPLADIVFAGADEAAIAVGGTADASGVRLDGDVDVDGAEVLARRIAAMGPAQVIIKLGGDGALGLIDGRLHRQEAIPVEVMDTVGAGDAFVAGYLAEFMADREPRQRLTTAARTGAFACLVPGDWEGLPRRSELDLLDSREPVSR